MTEYPDIATIFDERHYTRVNRLANALKSYNFRDKHLYDVSDLGLAVYRQVPVWHEFGFWQELVAKPYPKAFFAYNQISGRFVQPGVMGIAADKSSFYYHESLFPVFISKQHVEKRHAQRAVAIFDRDATRDVLAIAMVFSKLFEKTRFPPLEARLRSSQGLSFYMPDQEGLYVCRAQIIPAAEQDGHISLARTRTKDGQYAVHDPVPPPAPVVRIIVASYIGARDMTATKQEIFWAFQDLFKDFDMRNAVSVPWLNFTIPEATGDGSSMPIVRDRDWWAHKKAERDFPRLEEALRKLLSTRMWERVFYRPDEDVPDLNLKEISFPHHVPYLPCMRDPRTPWCAGGAEVTQSRNKGEPLPGLGGAPFKPVSSPVSLNGQNALGFGSRS